MADMISCMIVFSFYALPANLYQGVQKPTCDCSWQNLMDIKFEHIYLWNNLCTLISDYKKIINLKFSSVE